MDRRPPKLHFFRARPQGWTFFSHRGGRACLAACLPAASRNRVSLKGKSVRMMSATIRFPPGQRGGVPTLCINGKSVVFLACKSGPLDLQMDSAFSKAGYRIAYRNLKLDEVWLGPGRVQLDAWFRELDLVLRSNARAHLIAGLGLPIVLPSPRDVVEVFENRLIARRARSFDVDCRPSSTYLFYTEKTVEGCLP